MQTKVLEAELHCRNNVSDEAKEPQFFWACRAENGVEGVFKE